MFVLEYALPVLSGVCMNIFTVFILSKFLYRKPGFSPALVGVVAVVFSVVQVYFNTFHMSWVNYLSICTIYVIMNHIFFKGNFALKFGFSVIMVTIGGLSEMVFGLIPMVLGAFQYATLIRSPIFLAIVGFLVPIVFLCLGLFIAKIFPESMNHSSGVNYIWFRTRFCPLLRSPRCFITVRAFNYRLPKILQCCFCMLRY